MLKTASHMKDLTIQASDGQIGSVDEFYFDDETWAIRYMVVNTGSWLSRRSVLISPIFVGSTDWAKKELHIKLTKEQIENSPSINTQQPVSRQHEAEYMDYFKAPYYWGGSYMWGMELYPSALSSMPIPIEPQRTATNENSDSHLRSTAALAGYHIEAANGGVGHVHDFLVDQDTWSVRYLEVNTRDFFPGKKVLFSTNWIAKISWSEEQIVVDLPKEAIDSAPEYIESEGITREYESQLHAHYALLPYWVQDTAHTLPAGSAIKDGE